jgi:hypothetical protein
MKMFDLNFYLCFSKSKNTLKNTCNIISIFLKIPLCWLKLETGRHIKWSTSCNIFFSPNRFRLTSVKIWSQLKMSTFSSSYQLLDNNRNCHLSGTTQLWYFLWFWKFYWRWRLSQEFDVLEIKISLGISKKNHIWNPPVLLQKMLFYNFFLTLRTSIRQFS